MKRSLWIGLVLFGVAGCQCGDDVFADPTILLSSTQAQSGGLVVVAEPGGASVTRTVKVSNTGKCTYAFTATVEDSWLSVTPQTGTIPPSGSSEVTITVTTGTATTPLPRGTYLGTVVIAGTCTDTGLAPRGSPASIWVQLTIGSPDAGVDGGAVVDAGAVDGGADGG